MNVVLIGYRGSGKTSVGQVLAKRRGTDFFDADMVLTERAGRSIKAIFESDGEAAFRELESRALADLLRQPNAVLSLGGGVILRAENRTAIKQSGAAVVYLRADARTLHERIHGDPNTAANRPALTHLGGGVEEIETLLAAREPLYREVMTGEVEVAGRSVDAVADGVEALLRCYGGHARRLNG